MKTSKFVTFVWKLLQLSRYIEPILLESGEDSPIYRKVTPIIFRPFPILIETFDVAGRPATSNDG